MVKHPKVSVCIPVWNGERFLAQAIQSVVAQSFGDYELIVVDNASTDGTIDLVEKIAAGNDQVRLFRNEHNLGLVGNFNACLVHAQGEYIKFLCADDVLLPSCLERMVEMLDNHASVSLVAGGRMLIDENGLSLGIRRCADAEIVIPGETMINRCLFGTNYIGEPTSVMFRKMAASRGFRGDLPQLMDMEMWFHLLEQGCFACLPEALCAVRRHAGQMTVHSIKSGAMIEDNIRLFEEYSPKSYICHSWTHKASRRLRLAYRVWLSRQYLDPARKREILRRHSYPLAYWLVMPILGRVLARISKTHLLFRMHSPHD